MSETNKIELTDKQQEVVRAIMIEGIAYERARILRILANQTTKTISISKLINLIKDEK